MYGMGDAALADALGSSGCFGGGSGGNISCCSCSEAEAAAVRERVGKALPGLAAWMEGIDRRAAEEAVVGGGGGGGKGRGGGKGLTNEITTTNISYTGVDKISKINTTSRELRL